MTTKKTDRRILNDAIKNLRAITVADVSDQNAEVATKFRGTLARAVHELTDLFRERFKTSPE